MISPLLTVFRLKKARRTVVFADESELRTTQPKKDEDSDGPDQTMINSLCSLFVEDVGPVWIRLKISNHKLYNFHQPDFDDKEYLLTSAPSLSLSFMLEKGDISSKDRILLGYTLARSVWRYYNSNFMNEAWTTDSVQFIEKRYLDQDRQEIIDLQDPLFALHWAENPQTSVAEHLEARNIFFRYPRILALGVLLVEIGRKPPSNQPISAFGVNMNTQLMACRLITKNNSWPELEFRNQEIANTYRAAVQYCLDPANFHVSSSGLSKKTSQADIRRKRLYQNVVFPLERLCKDAAIMKSTVQDTSQDYHAEEYHDPRTGAAFLDANKSRK